MRLCTEDRRIPQTKKKTAEWGESNYWCQDDIDQVILHQEINPESYLKSAGRLIKLLEVASYFSVSPGDLIAGRCKFLHDDHQG